MASKEKQSPKVANSGKHTKRGEQLGDKKVKRQKRRATGVQRIGTGQDLLSQVREERRQQPRPKTRPAAANFINSLGPRVVEKADQFGWDATQRRLACDYVKSLVNTDGQLPEGIDDSVASTIQWKFAFTCLAMNVADDTFPGQKQAWYGPVMNKAEKVWFKKAA
ncbi:MAG TPA: hypothetical protein VFL81_00670 [Candidatus Saccharimonadales bacterium]|nr:hypothetical protein [Candidatus Saccharimonadales bacterium]